MRNPMPQGSVYGGAPLIVAPFTRPSFIIVPEIGPQVRVRLKPGQQLAGAVMARGFVFVSIIGQKTLFRVEPTANLLAPTSLESGGILRGDDTGIWYGSYRATVRYQRLCSEGLPEGELEVRDPRTGGMPLGVFGTLSLRNDHVGPTQTSLDPWDTLARRKRAPLTGISPTEPMLLLTGSPQGDLWAVVDVGGKKLFRYSVRQDRWDTGEPLPHPELHGPLVYVGDSRVIAEVGQELWSHHGKSGRWERLIASEDWVRHTGRPAPKYPHYRPAPSGQVWVKTDPGLYLFDPVRRRWREIDRTV